MINDKCHGFSILELLVCIVILAFFVTIVATSTGKFDEDVKTAAALSDMTAIQTAITHGLYPDLGCIPCNADYSDKSIEALFVPAYLFLKREEFKEMVETTEECVKGGYRKYIDTWNKYQSSGWGGPYMKSAAGSLDATYFDEEEFPKDSEDRHVYVDAMLTPWADKCEKMAREAEQEGESELAMEYRKGKYYQIYSPQKIVIPGCAYCYISTDLASPKWCYAFKCNPKWPFCRECKGEGYWKDFCTIARDNAYIICRGADCLPPPSDPEDRCVDVAAKLRCEAEIGEDAVEKCKSSAEDECADETFTSHVKCESCLQNQFKICVKKEHDNVYPECYHDGEKVPLETRLSIIDPKNSNVRNAEDYYMDIGDDLVMSVFGSVVRSPMDR